MISDVSYNLSLSSLLHLAHIFGAQMFRWINGYSFDLLHFEKFELAGQSTEFI